MRAIVFGASGALGEAILSRLQHDGYEVIGTSRSLTDNLLAVDPFGTASLDALDGILGVDAAVWAQGANRNDTVADVDLAQHQEVLQANLLFITATLRSLLTNGALNNGARLCMISSIWQEVVRQEKFSYSVSKAALGGLVRSASVDLADRGIVVNAVLPGAIDAPMTREVLDDEQIQALAESTRFGRLVSIEEVVGLISFLVSPSNTAVTGQSIAVDLGFSNAHLV